MSQPRYNTFNQIHKALRSLMFDTLTQMSQTDMADAAASQPVVVQTALLVDIFDEHAAHEDHFILNVAASYAPDVIADFEGEHVEDHRLSNALRVKLDLYADAYDAAGRYAAGFELYHALNEFVAFNLRHMSKEETILNEVLWKYYTDAEILGMQRNIQQSIPPEKAAVYLPWMIRGINDTEMVSWLSALKAEAPAFVVNGVTAACVQHLPAARWADIEARVQ